jgi:hypothetical protein
MTIEYWAALVFAAAPSTQDVPASTASALVKSPITALLTHDTPVELMAITEVSTATARPGTVVRLRVNKPIDLPGHGVIPVGTPAFGEVVTAKDAGGLGKSGTMTARLVRIQFGDAVIPLDGDLSAKGRGSGSAATAIVFVGVMGLFHRGNNAKIKAGEIVSAFVSEDVTLDLSAPIARNVAGAPTATAAPMAEATPIADATP